jgi:hypothetical protein
MHGLFRRGEWRLYGVAWWIPPTRAAAAASWEGDPDRVLALSRLVIDPNVPRNAATFLLGRSVRLLPTRWVCLVSYADSWRGHKGGIYRAAGWEYVGMTEPEPIYLIEGRMVARKAGPRTRTHAEMLALGAECVGSHAKHKYRLIRDVREKSRPMQERLFAS